MKFDKFNFKFIIITLIISLIVVPVSFNYLFMWESGLSKGGTSDWFTLYGNIIGGLLGGFFTYLALLLTFKEQKETKKEEMRPRIDIPYQTIDFVDTGEKFSYKQIPIELNNIGGSLAKNIECTLSLPNYDEVLTALDNAKSHLKIDIIPSTTAHIDDIADMETEGKKRVHMIVRDDNGNQKKSLGNIYNKYQPEFIGTCLPLTLNHEANVKYIIGPHVSYWINYIVQNRRYAAGMFNENELFNFRLQVKYSSDEYGEFSDTFNLKWKCIGIWSIEDGQLIFKYVLISTKVNT